MLGMKKKIDVVKIIAPLKEPVFPLSVQKAIVR